MSGDASQERHQKRKPGTLVRALLVSLMQVVMVALIFGLGSLTSGSDFTLPYDGEEMRLSSSPEYRFGTFSLSLGSGHDDGSVSISVMPHGFGSDEFEHHTLQIGDSLSLSGWGTLTLERTAPSEFGRPGSGGGYFRYSAPNVAWIAVCALALAIAGVAFSVTAWQRNRATSVTKPALGSFITTWLGISGFVWAGLGVVCNLAKLPRSFAVPLWAQITGLILIAASLAAIYLLPRPKRLNRLYQRVLWVVLGLSFIAVVPNPVVVVAGVSVAFGQNVQRYRSVFRFDITGMRV